MVSKFSIFFKMIVTTDALTFIIALYIAYIQHFTRVMTLYDLK